MRLQLTARLSLQGGSRFQAFSRDLTEAVRDLHRFGTEVALRGPQTVPAHRLERC